MANDQTATSIGWSPGLRAVRGTTTSLRTGIKDHYGVGRIEHGDTEWWGGGRVWRSAPGCILSTPSRPGGAAPAGQARTPHKPAGNGRIAAMAH